MYFFKRTHEAWLFENALKNAEQPQEIKGIRSYLGRSLLILSFIVKRARTLIQR